MSGNQLLQRCDAVVLRAIETETYKGDIDRGWSELLPICSPRLDVAFSRFDPSGFPVAEG